VRTVAGVREAARHRVHGLLDGTAAPFDVRSRLEAVVKSPEIRLIAGVG